MSFRMGNSIVLSEYFIHFSFRYYKIIDLTPIPWLNSTESFPLCMRLSAKNSPNQSFSWRPFSFQK